ncbi:MAG: contractile injection system tape measure protein [Azospirillaceae bacterium]|nr:contractile injection system tape measure protein [Azospirillaceae bacterium]
MPAQRHHLRRLSVEADLTDAGLAVALRSRVEDLARDRVPALLQRVFDAVVPAEAHVHLDRLDLDLGVLPAAGLEEAMLQTLETALMEALTEAVARARHAPDDDARSLTAEQTRLEALDRYLARGTLPFWAQGEDYAPAPLLRRVAAEQPAALAALLLRRGRERRVLERLVLQAGEDGLRDVLRLMTPDAAATILAYLADLAVLHREEPVAALAESALRRLLWLLTLDYLVREAGSQFNRRSYLADLLAGVVEREGIPLSRLMDLLRRGLERRRRHGPLGSSLPAVLEELLAGRAADAPPHDAAPPPEPDIFTAVAAAAETGRLDDLLLPLRRRAGDRPALEALLRRLSAMGFGRLVAAQEPAHADLILAYLADLAAAHHDAPLVALSDAGLDRLLRLLTLLALWRDPGSQFNRRDFMRRLLQGMAAADSVPYEALLDLLSRAAARTARHRPLSASFPAVMVELAGERAVTTAAQPPAPAAMAGTAPLARLEAALRTGEGLSELGTLVNDLAATTPGSLADLVRRLASQRSALHRLAGLAPDALGRLLGLLDAEHAELVLSYLDGLQALHRADALLPVDEAAFRRLTWALALTYVAREPGSQFNRRSLLRSLIHGIAAHDGLDQALLLTALRRGLDRLAHHRAPAGSLPAVLGELLAETGDGPLPADPLPLVDRFLRTGQLPGVDLRVLAAHDPTGLATLLRRLARAEPAAWTVRLERLLNYLLPIEVARLLAPDHAETMQRWLDREDGGDAAAWQQALAPLLRGEAPLTPVDGTDPTSRFDRAALLRHWLDHGTFPWWVPPGLEPSAVLDAALPGLADGPMAALHALFLVPDAGQRLARLARAVGWLGAERGDALLARLAPWARDPTGPLALLLRDRAPEGRRDILLRAAAAGLAGAPLNLMDVSSAGAMPLAPDAAPPPREPPPDRTGVDKAQALDWLTGDGADAHPALPHLARLIASMADAGDADLRHALMAGLAHPATRRRWAAFLPDEILGRLLEILAGPLATFLRQAAGVLTAAHRHFPTASTPPGALSGITAGGPPWAMLLDILAARPAEDRTERSLANDLVQRLAGADPAAQAPLLAQALFLARNAGLAGLYAVLQPPQVTRDHRAAAPSGPSPSRQTPAEPNRGKTRFGPDEEETMPTGESLYAGNAGLVLVAPFLPHFFKGLDVLSDGPDGKPRIQGLEAASRAVHLLQHLVDERCDRPEPDLVLNKLLCGLAPSTPVAPSIAPSEAELALCAQLTQAIIGNWPAIRSTSPAGLRETFLQRQGRLNQTEAGWALTVQRKTVDVLVDQVPWSFSVAFQRWMPAPIHVTW